MARNRIEPTPRMPGAVTAAKRKRQQTSTCPRCRVINGEQHRCPEHMLECAQRPGEPVWDRGLEHLIEAQQDIQDEINQIIRTS